MTSQRCSIPNLQTPWRTLLKLSGLIKKMAGSDYPFGTNVISEILIRGNGGKMEQDG